VHRKPVKPGGSLLLDLDTGGSVKVSRLGQRTRSRCAAPSRARIGATKRVEFDVKNNRATLRSLYDQPESGQFSSSNRVRDPRAAGDSTSSCDRRAAT
jgi:hypothetical protein